MASTHNNIKLGIHLKFENGIEERVCLPQTLNGQDKNYLSNEKCFTMTYTISKHRIYPL